LDKEVVALLKKHLTDVIINLDNSDLYLKKERILSCFDTACELAESELDHRGTETSDEISAK